MNYFPTGCSFAEQFDGFLPTEYFYMRFTMIFLVLILLVIPDAKALERPDVEFPIFQFPLTMIPCIDGDSTDWEIVPESYLIDNDLLYNEDFPEREIDAADMDISIRVGWVPGLNRLYFLYEASDEYWDFEGEGLHCDILEIIVDGDLSGGPLVKHSHPEKKRVGIESLHSRVHGTHAQNYHIFTPPGDRDWTMVWGAAQWIKALPYSLAAYSGEVRHGEGGRLTLEMFITPFDHADYQGPAQSVVTPLVENMRIGLGLVTLDYDGPGQRDGVYNITTSKKMVADASDLCAFRLMPLEPQFRDPIKADWTFDIVDMDQRLVTFKDLSQGEITRWTWDFGDGTTTTDRNPIYRFDAPGEKTVSLTVEGPEGSDRFVRVWDVFLK
jgi:hypothetical protein